MHQFLLPGGSAGPTLAVRDDVIPALVLLLLSAPADERGHAPTEVAPSRFRFGLSAGVGFGPRSSNASELWVIA